MEALTGPRCGQIGQAVQTLAVAEGLGCARGQAPSRSERRGTADERASGSPSSLLPLRLCSRLDPPESPLDRTATTTHTPPPTLDSAHLARTSSSPPPSSSPPHPRPRPRSPQATTCAAPPCSRTARRSTSACVHLLPAPSSTRLALPTSAGDERVTLAPHRLTTASCLRPQTFSEQEKELFQKYGKVPAQKNLLANKLKVRSSPLVAPTPPTLSC